MRMRRLTFRQMFIVDLVTLLLLVMVAALQLSDQPTTGTVGSLEANCFTFVLNGPASEVPPTLGVAYVSQGLVIVSRRNGPLTDAEHLEHVQILAAGPRVEVDVYDARGRWEVDDATLVVFLRDRGGASDATLEVTWTEPGSPSSTHRLVADSRQAATVMRQGAVDIPNAIAILKLADVNRLQANARWSSVGGE